MTFLLAHLSDAHIGPLPRPRTRDLIGKRLTGYVNWRRRGRLHDMTVLRRIVEDMRLQAPDHIAMTGDILNIGLPAEFPFARAWLETLGPPHDVSFVPGNHDAYVRSSMPHLAETFAPWAAEVGVDDGLPFAFPYLRRRGPWHSSASVRRSQRPRSWLRARSAPRNAPPSASCWPKPAGRGSRASS